MENFLKVLLDIGAYGLIAYMYFEQHKRNMVDIKNEELDRRERQRHSENMIEMQLLRENLNKLISTLSGKFINKSNYFDSLALKFREMQLFFYSKVDKNNVDKNLNEILNEVDLLLDDKLSELEQTIKLTGNDILSKEIVNSLSSFFKEYGEYIKKLFYYYKENHKVAETKRSISNLTSSYIQKCKDSLEKESC